MKRLSAKYSRPALMAVLVLALAMVMTVGSAFAIVEISDKFYITDEAEVISEETENHILNLNAYLEENCSGAQIGVVVVHWLDGMDIEDYCYKLFNQMQLGDANEDNGILLLLTIGEENYWCMQGKGLEKELTSAEIDDILWYGLEPDFAEADYDEGVLNVCNVFTEDLCDIYGVAYPSSLDTTSEDYYGNVDYSDEPLTMTDWIIFIVFILLLMAAALFVFTLIKKALRPRSSAPYTPASPTYHPMRPRRRTRPVIFVAPRPRKTGFGRPTHGGPGMPPSGSGRPTSRPTSRPSASRPTSRPTSRPSSFGGGGRSSRPSGFGGGGASRGGGAGRRGR